MTKNKFKLIIVISLIIIAIAVIPLVAYRDSGSILQHLDVQVSPYGAGSVSQSPVDVNGYSIGQVVTLIPIANPGYTFNHWQVGNNAPVFSNSLNYTVSSTNSTIEAWFIVNPKLTVTVSPDGAGVVARSPDDNGSGYPSGTVVTLTATANPGYTIQGWMVGNQFDAAAWGKTQYVYTTGDSNQTITVTFLKNPKLDTLVVTPEISTLVLIPVALGAVALYVKQKQSLKA